MSLSDKRTFPYMYVYMYIKIDHCKFTWCLDFFSIFHTQKGKKEQNLLGVFHVYYVSIAVTRQRYGRYGSFFWGQKCSGRLIIV